MLCHLKFGPIGIRVFCRIFPWLDEEFRHESILVHRPLEGASALHNEKMFPFECQMTDRASTKPS